MNVVTRSNGQKRSFSTLIRVLSVFDREDLDAVYKLVMDIYQDKIPEGFDKVLWGDLIVMFNPDEQDEFWNSQHEWKVVSWKLHSSSGVHTLMTDEGLVIHMLVEKKYPLKKEILMQMIKLKLESEEDSTMALELIRFIKKSKTKRETRKKRSKRTTFLKNNITSTDSPIPWDFISPEETPEFIDADDHPALNELEQSKSVDNLEPAKIQDYVTNEPITRSRIKDLEAASAHECLYVNFLFEMEPKKRIKALEEEEGWIIAIQEKLNQFEMNKVWTLVPKPHGLAECKASAINLSRIQVKYIVKEVKDNLKTYSSAGMDISWYIE
ncbi:hypothetical protein Tco_1041364 [Tanacetum coccineum]|uniref:Reverse transcriptase Ty1/copia-type domain-containing protein n=1 Tax=Tanacetum coccineum TaxID=301880 RepID=A0ABQ5GGZ9_9ASTR